jgi:CCR4-NOT transcription complex subunit 7/8
VSSLGSKSALNDIAEEFGIKSRGANQQAGHDSLLLGQVFFQLRSKLFGGEIDDSKFMSQVWGFDGVGNPASASSALHHLHNGGQVPSTPNTGAAQLAGSNTTPGNNNNQHHHNNHTNSSGGQQQQHNIFNPTSGQGGFGNFFHLRK